MDKPTLWDWILGMLMSAIIGGSLAIIYLDTIGVIDVFEILDLG